MVVSQRSLPSSMNIAASVAVMDLVQEPMWNWSLVGTISTIPMRIGSERGSNGGRLNGGRLNGGRTGVGS